MNIIFDENVPLPMRQFFTGHTVSTVQFEGWAGTENGKLIELVDGKFDVLILADKNLRYQQNLTNRKVALIELPTNRWPILKQMIPGIINAVEKIEAGSYTIIES